VLLAVGIATALVGGVMALAQASLKRMLAFVTIAHVGVGLIGIALLTPRGLAGATLYIVADGLVRGALFVAVAHIAYRLGSVDELDLRGRGRRLRLTGVAFAIGALGIAAIPPLGSWASWGLITQSAAGLRLPWLAAILILATMLPAAALLRACGRIFLGLGARTSQLLEHAAGREGEPSAAERRPPRRGVLFRLPGAALLVAGLGLAFAPQIVPEAVGHAMLVERPHEVAQEALRGIEPPPVAVPSVHASTATIVYGVVSVVGALALAAAALWWQRLPQVVRAAPLALRPLVAGLRSVHDGVVGEYVTWLTFGVAAIGTALAVLIR
jgi:multicomponent Na+:H+ antiporter subunit D